MHTINPTQPIQLINEPIFAQINDEIVLMSPKDDQNYAVNSVGTELWNLLETQAMSLEEMVTHLTQHYEVDEEQAMNDARKFVMSMMEHDLIVTNK